MVSNRFALLMIFHVTLLTVTLIGLSVALTTEGYHSITLLLGGITATLVFELYRHVSKTNAELTRFLEAVRYEDFGQRFGSSNPGTHTGAGFEELTKVFGDIMQRLKTSRQQQEENLQHLKYLTEHIPVPLLSLYPDGHILLHNNAARRLFGSVHVNKIEDLKVFSADFFDAIKNLKPGRRRLVNFSYDGMNRQMTVVATQIVTGTMSENLISLQDIQSELDGAQLQAWQDLVRVLTHEIMNSITPVASLSKTATDLVDDVRLKLNENASADIVLEELEDVRRAVDTVARRSDGLMQFVQSYRSLTLLPAPQKKTLLLTDLFQRVNELLAGHWATKGIDLTIKVEPESLQLFADPDLLEQLLINLLQNAEQALSTCHHPQLLPHVTITGRLNQRGYVLIEVADNGPGIPSDIANEIFVPFFTTKPHGSGVGLALTRQIMIAHGGSITVNKSDMGGAKFTLIF